MNNIFLTNNLQINKKTLKANFVYYMYVLYVVMNNWKEHIKSNESKCNCQKREREFLKISMRELAQRCYKY